MSLTRWSNKSPTRITCARTTKIPPLESSHFRGGHRFRQFVESTLAKGRLREGQIHEKETCCICTLFGNSSSPACSEEGRGAFSQFSQSPTGDPREGSAQEYSRPGRLRAGL